MLAFLLPLASKVIRDAVAQIPENEELGEKLIEICLVILSKAVKLTKKMNEGWSDKYKKSIDCNNPKGFSQRAHCQGKKKTFKEFLESI